MNRSAGNHHYRLVEGWVKLPVGWAFEDVCDIATDAQDKVYITNRSEHPVIVFDREGHFLRSWGEGFFKRPHGICVSPDGFIFCTDDKNHTVYKFTPAGKLLMTIGQAGQSSDTGYEAKPDIYAGIATIKRGAPPFNRPTGVAIARSGNIYVSDGYGNSRIHKFSPGGKLLLSWGEPGTEPGRFFLPHSVWVDSQERAWVTDWQNNRIQIFDARGKFLNQWTGLTGPSDIFIENEQTVYVSEEERRLSIFSLDGTLITRWDSTGEPKETATFLAPHCVAVDSHGDIYVGEVAKAYAGFDKGLRAVQKFARVN